MNSTTPFTFKTAKAAGVMDPYTIAFICDMGNMGPEGEYTSAGKGINPNEILAPGELNTIDSLTKNLNTFDMLVHPGDIAYADAWLKEEIGGFEPNTTIADGYKVYESILNGYYDEMQPITAYKPYMVAPGNHEANCDNGGSNGYTASICMPGQTNFTGYINHFRMPSDVSGGLGNMWYCKFASIAEPSSTQLTSSPAYDYGMVHYVFFSTETDLGNGLLSDEPPSTENAGPFGSYNQQINFLNNDLANVDRCKTPWVIALGHRPWFASGSNCANCSLAFAPIFQQYGVDVVLQGHFHVYERNYPVFPNGTIDPNKYNNPSSPWYIINGIAGHYDGMDSFTAPLQPYQAYGIDINNATYGWSRISFKNSSALYHEFIASNNDTVLDSNYLYKNHVCSSSSSSSSTVRESLQLRMIVKTVYGRSD
jgi:acid phosphatase type 7